MERKSSSLPRTYIGISIVIVAVAVISAGGYFAVTGRRTAADSVQLGPLDGRHPLIGAMAPDFRLVDARNPTRDVRLSDLRGKPVVLNWYATWCGPCRSELPEFQRAYEALHGEVVFIGVNLQESSGDATKFMDELKAHFPSILDQDGSVARQYRIVGMPSTFVIDREGVVRAVRSGAVDIVALKDMLASIGVRLLTYSTGDGYRRRPAMAAGDIATPSSRKYS